ncbi:hypothetical protein [Aestuariirhabdus sp. LZHN29]|uniref:hypothetical protein n=1 Tax=Aestuariirhabdus sp. LZHN29 TaxID=3417462 RepID=UPI003CEA66C7
MELSRILDERMPPLGWFLQRHGRSASVTYGAGVEWINGRLVEGVWSESFSEGHPEQSLNLFGSCVCFTGNTILICACTSPLEPIYFCQQSGAFYASNSQVLLLAGLGKRLVPGCTEYAALNQLRTRGLEQVIVQVPVSGGTINRFIHHNLLINESDYEVVEKKRPNAFRSYTHYKEYLQASLHGCIDNARYQSRHTRYELVTTQSRGYDSTAINALLNKKYPLRAFTCRDSKPIGEVYRSGKKRVGPSDEGSEIASQLGFECEVIERSDFERYPELEIFMNAAVHNNEDRNVLPIFAKVDKPSVLLTGNAGELWYTWRGMEHAHYEGDADNLLKKGDLGGFGMSEVRLWHNIVHITVPLIGAVQRLSVHDITESEEMSPWRLNNDYDRPIPRRIAEEAGVSRENFGQSKMGSVVMMPTPELPLDPAYRKAFLKDLVARKLLHPLQRPFLGWVQRYNNWILWNNPNRYFSDHRRYRLIYYCSRLLEKVTGKRYRFRPVLEHLTAELYRYSCNELAARYSWLEKKVEDNSSALAVADTTDKHPHEHNSAGEQLG